MQKKICARCRPWRVSGDIFSVVDIYGKTFGVAFRQDLYLAASHRSTSHITDLATGSMLVAHENWRGA